ncbi:hypothetical protein [Campylobacter sp. CS_ED2]|uniref:hypothetical protein n=1 Tax=Campylobacter sp. CS_ED2 TaxID=2984141 RepID=UPI0022E9AC3F|nr:hypothetical protein [Campylobacter sp. CS_ED2]
MPRPLRGLAMTVDTKKSKKPYSKFNHWRLPRPLRGLAMTVDTNLLNLSLRVSKTNEAIAKAKTTKM